MDTETIQLEAFNTSLYGARVLYQMPTTGSKVYPPLLDAIKNIREPFRKRIRVTTRHTMSTYLPLPYDVIFQVKEASDWTMIVTYITYTSKPLLVVVEDIMIPDGLWSKLQRSTTLLHITTHLVSRLHPYDAIFFSPIEELTTAYVDYIHRALQSIYRANYTMKEHKEILQEVRVAHAGIAWTKYNEDSPTGGIYWYDPVPYTVEEISRTALAEWFEAMASYYRS